MIDFGWILSPAAQYGALALTLIACLALFISAKFELHSTRRLAETTRDAAAADIEKLLSQLSNLKEDLESLSPAAPPTQGLNLNRRLRALRMHRRGEAAATIAAALRVPPHEVELLLKLQRIVQSTPSILP